MGRREERRLVTCLFVDVVGSTELVTRLGPERLKRHLDLAFSELREEITLEGGTVEKFVGDAIYAIFGAPVAHPDDPLRALRAAAEIRAWGKARTAGDAQLAVRIGVETGEAIVDVDATETTRQQMSVGAVVNIAARLQQRAEPGEVLVGPTCAEAVGSAADLEMLGEVEVRGVGRLPLFRLVRVGTATLPSLPFVGRESELELLDLALRRARGGRAVLALVSGPPGQGKTRLVGEVLRRAPDVNALVARCRPGGETGALTPLRQLLGPDGDDEATLRAAVAELFADAGERERVAAALAHSAGLATSSALGQLGPVERDDEIVNAWHRYLLALGGGGLVALWVEDLHWAERTVVRLVDRLTLGAGPLLVLGTARPEFAEQAGLRPSGDRFFVELEGLDDADALRLAADAGRADARAIQRADGNPLFIVELARARVEGDLPLTLQGALGARLDELPPSDRALLSRASIAGETFSPDDAAFLAERDTSQVARSLARLTDLHYMQPIDGRYRFHHSLLRDVAYGRLLAEERMHAHARYAQERVQPEDAASLAHHWAEALRPPDAEWVWKDVPGLAGMRRAAFAAHLDAGRQQGAFFAPERAAELLARALSFADGPADRAAAERAMADAYALDLRGDEAWSHYVAALAAYRQSGTVPADFFLGPLKIVTRWGAFGHMPAKDEIAALTREAEATARTAGDDRTLARVLVYSAFEDRDPSSMPGDRARIDEAVRLANASGDMETRREVLGWFANQLMRELDLDGALRVLDEVEAMGTPSDAELQEYLRGRAVVAWRRGDLPELNALADRGVAISRRMGPHLRTHSDMWAAQAALARGDWAEAERVAHDTARLVAESTGTKFCGTAATAIAAGAVSHARAGRGEEARALVRALDARAFDWSQAPQSRVFALALTGDALPSPEETDQNAPSAAVVAVVRRDHERALAIAERLERGSRGGARFYGALAEAVREEVAHDKGGAEPRHSGLRTIGYIGWSELLRRRVDAEY